MADTTVLSGLELTKWRSSFISEFVRDSGFMPYMGDSEQDIIHVVNDLKTSGYTIRIPLLGRPKSNGVSGNQRLSGNEETLDEYYQDITWDFFRNAVQVTKKEREKSAVDLLAARRPFLKTWASELIKYQTITCFHLMTTGVAYSLESATNRNAFVTNNTDRILFGHLKSNASSGVMATALATIANSTDNLSPDIGKLAKRMAKTADPHIRPFKTGTQGREFYVMFCHPYCFRDLKKNTTIIANNQNARSREGDGMDKNPLFQDGDLIDDGIIYREIPEFYQGRFGGTNADTHLVGAGSSVDVGVNFLCGAQAIGMVQKQAALPISKKEDDYGFIDGIGVELAQGFQKLRWNNNANGQITNGKDYGMVTVYAAASADA